MAIQIAKNIYRLPTLGPFINSYAFINNDSSVTLVDCGLEGSSRKLILDLERIGKHPKDITNIILGGWLVDHVGRRTVSIYCDRGSISDKFFDFWPKLAS